MHFNFQFPITTLPKFRYFYGQFATCLTVRWISNIFSKMHFGKNQTDFDCIIVGGSFAGLSAAMALVRARQSVAVFDAGGPRNTNALDSHGFLGHDGVSPNLLLTKAKSEVSRYPTARILNDLVIAAHGQKGSFVVDTQTKKATAQRLILAFGAIDQLPNIPNMNACWGKTVIKCPYCHGLEFADLPTGILYFDSTSISQAIMMRAWSSDVALFLNGNHISSDERTRLARKRILVHEGVVDSVVHENGYLRSVTVKGRDVRCKVLYLFTQTLLASPIAKQLGCKISRGIYGDVIDVNDCMETTIPGVFAAGDITRSTSQIAYAVADGLKAGTNCHKTLLDWL